MSCFVFKQLLKFVAMASADDLDANSEFLKFADEVVPVPGGPSRNNYGNVDLICESAVKYKVHPPTARPPKRSVWRPRILGRN